MPDTAWSIRRDAPPVDSVDVLNRLLVIEYRSLPMYLAGVDPWTDSRAASAKAALARIVADQTMYAGRIAEEILQRRGWIEAGEYPLAYTDTHFLALEFLLKELAEHQRQNVAAIEDCVAQLSGDPAAQALAEEVLGNARGHLETLTELVATSSGARW